MSDNLSPEAVKAVAVIEKLLRLAGRNPNEHEAAQAQAKAMELMTAYNLDMAAVEENSGESGKRADEKLRGGHYQYQRDLWQHVAELNFCLYFSVLDVVRVKKWERTATGFRRAYDNKNVRSHRVVGRTVNTRSTKVMAQYLESAIERIAAGALVDRFGEEDAPKKTYSKWANSFREGMVERICEKIYDRRSEMMAAEREKKEEAARAARESSMAGVSTSTAITIAGMTEAEREANLEFIDPGRAERLARWKAQDAAARARQAEAKAAAEAAYTAWAAANPEAARLEEERRRKQQEQQAKEEARRARRRERYYQQNGYRERSYGQAYKGDWSARKAGYEAGERVSIDQQADHASKPAGVLG